MGPELRPFLGFDATARPGVRVVPARESVVLSCRVVPHQRAVSISTAYSQEKKNKKREGQKKKKKNSTKAEIKRDQDG